MNALNTLTAEELRARLAEKEAALAEWKAKGLSLDLTRGKPNAEQLDLSLDILNVINTKEDCFDESGFDCRNYGILDGIPAAKKLFADLMDTTPERVIIGGNSALNMMYDTIARALIFGVYGGARPWGQQGKVKFLCPAPGYDRHFFVTETLGFELIPIEMKADGPDMDMVEKLVSIDPTIKGIWCVPKYSNPEGVVYSDETVRRFAALKPAADDFRIFWDNAYAVHDLYDDAPVLLDIFEEAAKHGNEDMIFEFASTSKITFPGNGIALMVASENNINQIKPLLGAQTIGSDKMNQLRHVKYFKTADGIKEHMKRHAEIIRPKFDIVIEAFRANLTGIAEWTEPKGGYFVDLAVPDGCAKAVYDLAGEMGVALTKAGASYPYGVDPRDRHLRIAPTFPTNDNLRSAVAILCLCVEIVAIKKLLNQ
ncbi:MAG: aminotransferase class I/II-fold pyridoxal phosphate-dependent enzyme [Clostridia bacterium]|nr:aminotransferase class I/II-fold pyridoxal phosphate-dependent enzyme [Clostridia bacterium]